MKILWCEEHGQAEDEGGSCWRGNQRLPDAPCRMVPMRLIPDNGETVERLVAALRSVWPVDPTWWPDEEHAVRVLADLYQETHNNQGYSPNEWSHR